MRSPVELFVLLTEDPALDQSLRAALANDSELLVARSFAEVLVLAQRQHVRGAVVDGRALTGRAETKLARLRDDAPLLQVLFVTDDLSAGLLNDLQPLRVDIVARPLPPKALATFVLRTLSAGRLPSASVTAYIDQLATAHRLNGKEVSLFSVVLDHETAAQARQRLGLGEEVFSRTMRRLLRKCHMRSQDRLAKRVLRDALLSTRALTASMVEPLTSPGLSL